MGFVLFIGILFGYILGLITCTGIGMWVGRKVASDMIKDAISGIEQFKDEIIFQDSLPSLKPASKDSAKILPFKPLDNKPTIW